MANSMILHKQDILDQYYLETNTQERKRLLDQYIQIFPTCSLNTLRKGISKIRYKERTDVDIFLWQYINLLCLYKSSNSRWMRKSANKELDQIIQSMGFNEAKALGEAGEYELYREFYNVSLIYIKVCKDDKSYNTKYFGIVTMDENQVDQKIAQDLWKLAVGIPERFNKKKELELFCRAVKDTFFDCYTDAQALWKKAEEERRKI